MLMHSPKSRTLNGHLNNAAIDPQGTLSGRVIKRHVDNDPGLAYCLFVAEQPKSEAPVFVAVHGIRRGMRSQARRFAPFVDAVGGIMVAPLFSRRRFPDYQRLGRLKRGDRADVALKRVITDAAKFLRLPFKHLVMFGYSGGGQFVHRYAMANPRQVKRIAIAAPGWYTFPDTSQPFPRGIGKSASLPDVIFDPARFLQIPTLVLVGEKDVIKDENLNTSKKIRKQQGANRLDRGQRWIAEMAAAAGRFRLNTPLAFQLLPECGHSFVECMETGRMGRAVFNFLYPDDTQKNASATVNNKIRPGVAVLHS